MMQQTMTLIQMLSGNFDGSDLDFGASDDDGDDDDDDDVLRCDDVLYCDLVK